MCVCVENDFTTSKIFDRYVISVPTIPKTNILTMLLSIKTRIVNIITFMGRAQPCMPNPFFKYFFMILINNEPILTSTLAAGIVSEAFS